MPQPHRTAGRGLPMWGSAALLSVAAHGLGLSAWWQWTHDGGPLSRARKVGVPPHVPPPVQLVAVARPPAVAAPAVLTSPSPAAARPPRAAPGTSAIVKPRPRHQAPTPSLPAPAPAAVAARLSGEAVPAPASVAFTAPAAPPVTPPGGRFAGLFAPITTQALGSGHWGAAAPRPADDEASHRWRDQQAMMAASQALRQRAQAWVLGLQSGAAAPLKAACDVHMSLVARTTAVSCQEATDQARLAQELGGSASAAQKPATPQPSDMQCLHVEGKVAEWVACPDTDGGAGSGAAPLAAR